ncbi:MAG TPA: endonuclease/exonuclease/phosphatase family protein [Terriglobales bacterium]|nr:endonuclease/exonuclease/phosphatase family protein [Terriglobales bacterium]
MHNRDNGNHVIRVASYNIHRCVGLDGRHDPDRVAGVLRELDADLIGLQEVDSRYHVEGGIDQIDYLAQSSGFYPISGPTLIREDASYGNALLTRWPPLTVELLDLSVDGREKRGAIDVAVEVAGIKMRIVVTHFGLGLWERKVQTNVLLKILGDATEPLTVLCGDFNEWVPRWPTVRLLDLRLGRARSAKTFPARWPALGLDRIWVQPNHAVREVRAHNTALARVASDHLPLVASIELP